MNKWDKRFLNMAKLVASWSKDPSTQCGAVIVDPNNRLISVGFNGFPQGVLDFQSRLENREEKLKLMVHAEANALLFSRQSVKGCTMYTWPMMMCSHCTALAIQSGIKLHVSIKSDNERWKESFIATETMLNEADVGLRLYGALE